MCRSTMKFSSCFTPLILLLIFYYDFSVALFFPSASVFQITSALSVPVVLKDRKIFWDWAIQMNYNLPDKPVAFYNAPIWVDEFLDGRHSRDLRNETAKYRTTNHQGIHPSDFTAGELYASLENMLEQHYGFHETCLLRSVCELARHPFADEHRNMLTELLTFVLTPSLHEAFGSVESVYRSTYEDAERRGFLGQNCAHFYPECRINFLDGISKLLG